MGQSEQFICLSRYRAFAGPLVALAMFATVGLLLRTEAAWPLIPFTLVCAIGFFLRQMPTLVHLHTDGLRIRPFGRGRFVPYSQLARVTRYSEAESSDRSGGQWRVAGVRLDLRDGDFLELPMVEWSQRADGTLRSQKPDETSIEGLLSLLEARMGVQHLGAIQGALVQDTFRRGAQGSSEWLSRLSSLGAQNADSYRSPSLPAEALLAIVEDPRSLPTARAGAAVALRASLDDTTRARLRVAASSTGSPELRAAIDAVADETPDEELLKSLEVLDD